MKKLLSVTMLLLLTAFSLTAVEFSIGPKVAIGDYGYTGSDWRDFKDASDIKDKVSGSFAGGLFINSQFSKLFGIQIEGLYTYSTVRFGDSDYWIQEMYSAITIPAYVRLNFGSGPGGFFVLAGPRFDIYLDPVKAKDSDGTTDEASFSDAGYESFQVGISLGGGYSFPVGSGKLDLGLVYNRSFTKLDESGTSDLYFNGLEIQVGYGFSL